jgi:ABC-type uncharacterized transport system auxiliary subunit
MSMTLRWRRLWPVLFAAAWAGCTLSQPVPAISHYVIPGGASETPVGAVVPLQVGQIDALPPFQQTGIAYQLSPYRLDNYRLHQWVASPAWMLRERLQEMTVAQPGQQLDDRPPLELAARIFAFQQMIDTGASAGRVEIRFCLRPAAPPAVPLWCRTIREQAPASAATPGAAAEAIGTAFNLTLVQLRKDLDQELSTIAADGHSVMAFRHPLR